MTGTTTVPIILDLDWECYFPSNSTGSDLSLLNCSEFLEQDAYHYDTNSRDPAYYSIKYRIVGTVFQGIVLIVGVLGNIMVVIVVTQTRSMHTPTNCYLVSLSIADFMTLLASVPNEILAYYLLGDEWIWGRVGCAIFIFLQYLGINVSALSITAFTVERYIAICHPMKAQIVCTVSRAKKIIIGAWIFAFMYCSPWLFLTKTKTISYKGQKVIETCTFALSRNNYLYLGYFFADLVLFYIFPLLLSCVLYGLIARVLFSRDIQRSHHGKSNGMVSAQQSKKSVNGGTNARAQIPRTLESWLSCEHFAKKIRQTMGFICTIFSEKRTFRERYVRRFWIMITVLTSNKRRQTREKIKVVT